MFPNIRYWTLKACLREDHRWSVIAPHPVCCWVSLFESHGQLQISTMNLRQKLQVILLLVLSLLAFATYHAGTGGVMWLQWLSLITIFSFMFIFDLAFTNESQFIFDPDADNWRRKVVSSWRATISNPPFVACRIKNYGMLTHDFQRLQEALSK